MHVPMEDDFASALAHATAERALDIPVGLRIVSFSATYGKARLLQHEGRRHWCCNMRLSINFCHSRMSSAALVTYYSWESKSSF